MVTYFSVKISGQWKKCDCSEITELEMALGIHNVSKFTARV
jgi:hypothetical protein